MTLEDRIRQKLNHQFQPSHLEVDNESYKHQVPEGAETHFRVLIVSQKFEGLSRIDRQRAVNTVLAEELKGGVHALTQRALSPSEWESMEEKKTTFASPECAHSKR